MNLSLPASEHFHSQLNNMTHDECLSSSSSSSTSNSNSTKRKWKKICVLIGIDPRWKMSSMSFASLSSEMKREMRGNFDPWKFWRRLDQKKRMSGMDESEDEFASQVTSDDCRTCSSTSKLRASLIDRRRRSINEEKSSFSSLNTNQRTNKREGWMKRQSLDPCASVDKVMIRSNGTTREFAFPWRSMWILMERSELNEEEPMEPVDWSLKTSTLTVDHHQNDEEDFSLRYLSSSSLILVRPSEVSSSSTASMIFV